MCVRCMYVCVLCTAMQCVVIVAVSRRAQVLKAVAHMSSMIYAKPPIIPSHIATTMVANFCWVCLFSKTYTWILIYYVIVHKYLNTFTHFANFFFQSCIKFIAFDFKCESKALPRRQCIFSNIWFFILWIRTLIGTIASIFCSHKIMLK